MVEDEIFEIIWAIENIQTADDSNLSTFADFAIRFARYISEE